MKIISIVICIGLLMVSTISFASDEPLVSVFTFLFGLIFFLMYIIEKQKEEIDELRKQVLDK